MEKALEYLDDRYNIGKFRYLLHAWRKTAAFPQKVHARPKAGIIAQNFCKRFRSRLRLKKFEPEVGSFERKLFEQPTAYDRV